MSIKNIELIYFNNIFKIYKTPITMVPRYWARNELFGSSLSRLGLGYGALSEAILEPTRHSLKVSHAASSGSSLPLSLGCPSDVAANLGGGIAARSASRLLLVEGNLSAATAGSVSFSLPLSERLSTFSLFAERNEKTKNMRMNMLDDAE